MEVIYSLSQIDKIIDKTGVSLGTFDGLHKGHLTLINALLEKCRKRNLKSVIYTFSNHPREIINSQKSPKLIINNKQKIDLFNKLGIDFLVIVEFDSFQKNISPKDFVEKILLGKFNMSSIVVGSDCHFGKKAEGDIALLRKFTTEYDFDLTVVPPVMIENEIVSSTAIRYLLSHGLIKKANLFLERNYSITGKVIEGKRLGSKLGFPTANISVDLSLCLPKPGVYLTKTIIDKNVFRGVTNVGFNPTFNQKNYNVETFILDFNENIYNKELKIEFLNRIRDEIKFNNIDELCSQIKSDVAYARDFFYI